MKNKIRSDVLHRPRTCLISPSEARISECSILPLLLPPLPYLDKTVFIDRMSPSFLYNFFLGRKKSGEGNSQSPSNLAPSSFSSHSSSLAAMEAPDTADIREETMESWSTLLEPGASEGGDLAELWKADLSQLLIGHMFAAGSRSRIYRGIYKDNAVAVKMVKALEQDDCELRALLEKQFTCEVSMLSRLSHPNIVQFIAACRKPPMYCIITEYMPQGTLRMYLHKKEPFSLSTGRILRLALDISRGMKYLHAQGVVHRDLKSDNLLLDAELRVKVADFGTSCLETRRRTSRGSNPGTYRWMAPEMIKNKACTKKVDVYSFGMVLWELTTALVPFQEMTPVQAAYAACEKNLRPALSEKCPAELNNLIKSCWSANPSRRPDFDDIVRTLERLDRCLRDGTPLSSSTVKLRNRISHLRSFTGCIAACSFVPVSA